MEQHGESKLPPSFGPVWGRKEGFGEGGGALPRGGRGWETFQALHICVTFLVCECIIHFGKRKRQNGPRKGGWLRGARAPWCRPLTLAPPQYGMLLYQSYRVPQQRKASLSPFSTPVVSEPATSPSQGPSQPLRQHWRPPTRPPRGEL